MKYYKDLTTGAVVTADQKPAGAHAFWREATEREYTAYRERIARMIGNLEKAVAYKARILGVNP